MFPHLKVVTIDWAVSIPMPHRADAIRTISAEDRTFGDIAASQDFTSASTQSAEDKSIEFKRFENVQTEMPREN